MGRAGRGGEQAVCVFLRKRGERTPREMKSYLKQDTSACLKKGMVEIFTLNDPDGEGVASHNFSFPKYHEPFKSLEIFCSQLCMLGKRRKEAAVRLALKPDGVSAASAGQYYKW